MHSTRAVRPLRRNIRSCPNTMNCPAPRRWQTMRSPLTRLATDSGSFHGTYPCRGKCAYERDPSICRETSLAVAAMD